MKIAELIKIPDQVHRGDFVLKLTEGVTQSEKTLESYVVTPQLVKCFDQALTLIKAALESDSSKGSYLHGSFGSGKSHFMAVLSLILQGHPAARSLPELADVVTRHNQWTEGKRILVVPYHLIGAVSLESAVLGQYAAYVRKLHPEAPTPGFYRAEKIFEDARNLREQMGDERFFARLGAESGGGGGWGALETTWDAESFEEALEAPPGSDERARLIGDLVDSYFKAQAELAAGNEEGFVPLDEGLAILSRHAKGLGYDAAVLFLDELILWLASHAADPSWVNREGQKVAKLVEAADMDRALPIVSFIARQRDLRELVGEHLPGANQLGFADVLNWWEARFETINLEDENLPAIVEKRLLKPKSEAAELELQSAFRDTTSMRQEVLDTLLTQKWDRQMFRQVYPFSPALIQTLIALSSLLQRERTALRLLLQLLVDQRDSLEVGDLVPVGDLFDVIESGDEPFTQAMKDRFDQARKLYRTKLIPLLEEQLGVTYEEMQSGTAAEDKARPFRNDARLMKTLILSSLADGVEALKGLTPSRLAALNHGTVRTPIPGQESQVVLDKVRRWAARVGEIKVADDARNPVISVQLVGVDTEGIFENAKAIDNYGNRVRKVRELLFDMAGIEQAESLLPTKYRMRWRGTERECEIVFQNVRELPLDSLEPQDAPWRIIIDFPFDEPNKFPSDDFAKIQDFLADGRTARTLVWLPAFLTPEALDELGRLVVLDHVLSGSRLDEYGSHLSQIDREQARVILANQREQIRQRIKNFVLTAYGVSSVSKDAVDADHDLDKFHALTPGVTLQPPVGATMRDALEGLFDQALRFQYPDHPQFDEAVTTRGLSRILDVVTRAAQAADHRVLVDRPDRDLVRRIAMPLKLGRMGEDHFVLDEHWVNDFAQKRAQDDVQQLTAGRLREWINRPRPLGMPGNLENLVILTWAAQANHSFRLHSGPFENPGLDRLPNELELRAQTLPEEDDWNHSVQRAGSIFGVAVPPFRSTANVDQLVEHVRTTAKEHLKPLESYVGQLTDRLVLLGIDPSGSQRLRTAKAAHALTSVVASVKDSEIVSKLAEAEIMGSEIGMGTALKKASALAQAIEHADWEVLDAAGDLPHPHGSRGVEILDQVREALRNDEHVTALVPVLSSAKSESVSILTRAAHSPQPRPDAASEEDDGAQKEELPDDVPPTPTYEGDGAEKGDRRHRRVRAPEIEDVLDEVRREATQVPEGWVEVEWCIERADQ